MLKMANSRRAGLSAKLPVAEHGLHRPSRATSFRDSSTSGRRQVSAIALGLALTLGLLLCGRAAPAGLVHQYRMNIEAKRYAEALRIGRLIEQRHPNNAMGDRHGQYNRWLEKQVNPKEEAGK
jgi:hypothetical protein